MKTADFNRLIALADQELRISNMYADGNIAETYNGKTAALSVSVAMSDILPTLAMYFQDFDTKRPNNPCRRNVLNVVARMIDNPNTNAKFTDAEELMRYSVGIEADLQYIKRHVIDSAIALKHVVRTYKLI
ncbi:hypothetical protein [Tannerella sp.]|uniref:hypothetical protein n=1 Tax=Tannerella sp. TaxID=2382127 RepID=UPI0026DAF9C8|nr:hypothetical protein [Tannerella sp.]MDO4703658.1 hypothetical protein [Tannerella sp.]